MAKLKFTGGALSLQQKQVEPATAPSPKTHFSGKDKVSVADQLLPTMWRDVPFPISSIRVTVAQDLVEHKYWGVDGADVEATGRAPMHIEATIPFFNGIVPGKGERWGTLYPDTFRAFLTAFVNRSTDFLQHPELGRIACRPASCDFAIDAHRRDGVEVTARWIEDASLSADLPFERTSPVAIAGLAALDLDAAQKQLGDPSAPQFGETFEDLVNKLSGVIDTTASRISLLLHKPDQVLYRVGKVQESVDRAKNVLEWPINEACEKLKEAFGPSKVLGTGSAAPTNKRRPTARLTTSARLSLSQLQAMLPSNSIDDLIELNPRFVARPVVPPGSVVRYYT